MITVKRFTASWCGPCRMLAPVFEQLTRQFSNVKFETINTEVSPEITQLYNIKSIPVVLMFRDNTITPSVILVGANPKQLYITKLEELINEN